MKLKYTMKPRLYNNVYNLWCIGDSVCFNTIHELDEHDILGVDILSNHILSCIYFVDDSEDSAYNEYIVKIVGSDKYFMAKSFINLSR